jgi:carnitine 3-dehydrogenase
VAVLQALRGQGVGAGTTLAEYERTLIERSAPHEPSADLRWETSVLPEWVDYNGHATESSYLLMTSHAADELLGAIGIDAEYLRAGGSYFTVETHICHLGEAKAGDRLVVTTQVLGADEKRLHVFHRVLLSSEGELVATVEQMLLHVDTAAGRAAPARADVLARVRRLADAHRSLEQPNRVGRRIELPAAGRTSLAPGSRAG